MLHRAVPRWAVTRIIALGCVAACVAMPASSAPPVVVPITARKFAFTPQRVTLKKGVPVVLELTSLDRLHGFNVPDLGVRADVLPGRTARVALTPEKVGTFAFHCDNFCGNGHPNMTGEIVVVE